jgi:bacterioferritin-associated ferredoxin
MFLCVCSAITEDQAAWAVSERGARDAEGVFSALGSRPDCQRCLAFMEAAVLQIRAGRPVTVALEDPQATPWGCRGRCRPAWGTPSPAMELAS